MEKVFLNQNPSEQFTFWAVKNLEQCFSRDSLIMASEANKKNHPEDKELFDNFINEMYKYSHSDVLKYYREVKKEKLNNKIN
jgi:hypothetical protein